MGEFKPGVGSRSLPGPTLASRLQPLPAWHSFTFSAGRGSLFLVYLVNQPCLGQHSLLTSSRSTPSSPLARILLGQIAVIPMLPLGSYSLPRAQRFCLTGPISDSGSFTASICCPKLSGFCRTPINCPGAAQEATVGGSLTYPGDKGDSDLKQALESWARFSCSPIVC